MTKFTKGPWVVYAEMNVRNQDGEPVAACGPSRVGNDCGNAENKANAALIAAAPELYEALQEMTALAEGPTGGVSVSQKIAILAKARAALAKAEGK